MMHDRTANDFHDPITAARRLRTVEDNRARRASLRAAAAETGADSRWFVIIVDWCRTLGVVKAMREHGIEAWAPVEKRTVRKARTGARFKAQAAVWPGYVFVRIRPVPAAMSGVQRFDGVERFLQSDGRPAPLPGRLVDELQVFFAVKPQQRRFLCAAVQCGDRVMLPQSAFAGLPGVVTDFDSARRMVDVEITLFGGAVSVVGVALDQVRAID